MVGLLQEMCLEQNPVKVYFSPLPTAQKAQDSSQCRERKEEREQKIMVANILIFCFLLYHLLRMAVIPKVLHVSVAAEAPAIPS